MLTLLSGDLPPTATYARRGWAWVGTPGCEAEGRLTVTLQKGRRAGSKCESDTYAVQRQPAPVGHHADDVYLLLNLTDPDQPDVYEATLSARGPAGD